MDAQTLSIVTIFLASVISAGLAFLAAMWVNQRKVPVEVDKNKAETEQSKAETKLVEGGLAEKYHSLANLQADENIELTNQNMELKKQIDDVRIQMLELDRKHVAKENELEAKLEEEVKKRLAAEDYIKRLLYYFKAWEIEPPPLDLETAKAEKVQKLGIEGASKFISVEKPAQ
jgi:hypothetical protein